jgi:hypothetical protein
MFKGRFILVSSPDERCWGESEFLKARGDTSGAFRFFPMWSLDELLAARPFMDRWGDISDDEIKERYRQVGVCAILGYGWSGDKFTIENAIPVSETVHEKVMAEGQYWLGK